MGESMSNEVQSSSEEVVIWRKRIPLKRSTIAKIESVAASTIRSPEQMAAFVLEKWVRDGGKADPNG